MYIDCPNYDINKYLNAITSYKLFFGHFVNIANEFWLKNYPGANENEDKSLEKTKLITTTTTAAATSEDNGKAFVQLTFTISRWR